MSPYAGFDEDAMHATIDLIGRAGAKNFEIGWLNEEDEPAYAEKGAQWYAHAQYKGARLIAEDHKDPVAACDELARKVLTGARCKCGKLVALSDDGAVAYSDATMADGSKWSAEEAMAAGQCRWTRMGKRWESACGLTGQGDARATQNRAQRRKKRKK